MVSGARVDHGGPMTTPGRRPRSHRWILRRLLLSVVTLFAVSFLVFAATQILPGDPAEAILGQAATPERVEVLRQELNLDRPVLVQYWDWLTGLLTGDLGTSLSARAPVSELIGARLENSLLLVLLVSIVAIPLALVLGSVAAVRQGGVLDRAGQLLSLVFMAVPEFVTGLVLVMVFATTVFTVLPAVALIPPGESPLQHLDELVLPVATLVLAIVPYLFRLVRASMIDALAADYVQMARLKGMPEGIVMRRHALPNALIPTIQASALMLAYLLGGVLVVEYLFAYPGLGSLLADAVAARDLPVVQTVSLIFAAGIVLFNLAADIVTVYVTPRLRTAAR